MKNPNIRHDMECMTMTSAANTTQLSSSSIPLPRAFYSRDTALVARELLGTTLVRKIANRQQIITGIISETEAYGHENDPASHAYKNKTQRNHIMFDKVGISYVYFTYGMHYCFNVTARDTKRSKAGAVLIRGILPQKGIKTIMKNRNTKDTKILTNGPAKITQAFEISSEQYGKDLTVKNELYITGSRDYNKTHDKGNYEKNIIKSSRIGIRQATDKLWNFKLKM